MKQRGGGIRDIELLDFTAQEPRYFQLRASFETCDSMGANFINSVLERFADTLEQFFTKSPELHDAERDVDIVMSILSNYTPDCLVRAWVECPTASFESEIRGRGLDMGRIAELERWAAGLKPDLTFLLDVGVSEGLARARSRGGEPDRIEREREDFFERVRAVYLARAAAEPQRFRIVDAAQPVEAVVAQVTGALRDWIEGAR